MVDNRDELHEAGRPVEPRHGDVPESNGESHRVTLCDADAAAIDRLLGGDRDVPLARLGGGAEAATDERDVDAAEREARLSQLMSLLDHWEAPQPSADLVAQTQRRIAEADARKRGVIDAPRGRLGGFRLAELVGLAAVVLITASLLVPMMSRSRAEIHRIACMDQLGEVGRGFVAFAGGHDGLLPRRHTEPGTPWWEVGSGTHDTLPVTSNTANLYRLVTEGYTDLADLADPANPHATTEAAPGAEDWPGYAQVSYSYQVQMTPEPIRLADRADQAILADRNPLFTVESRRFEHRDALALDWASRVHEQPGQNVLNGDGSAVWTTSPVQHGDNIWTVDGVAHYVGNEVPGEGDVFLAP